MGRGVHEAPELGEAFHEVIRTVPVEGHERVPLGPLGGSQHPTFEERTVDPGHDGAVLVLDQAGRGPDPFGQAGGAGVPDRSGPGQDRATVEPAGGGGEIEQAQADALAPVVGRNDEVVEIRVAAVGVRTVRQPGHADRDVVLDGERQADLDVGAVMGESGGQLGGRVRALAGDHLGQEGTDQAGGALQLEGGRMFDPPDLEPSGAVHPLCVAP